MLINTKTFCDVDLRCSNLLLGLQTCDPLLRDLDFIGRKSEEITDKFVTFSQ